MQAQSEQESTDHELKVTVPTPMPTPPPQTGRVPEAGAGTPVIRSLSVDSLGALAALGVAVERPRYDVTTLRPGVVHIGVSSFFRAHQAVYLDRVANEVGSREWGILGVGMRRSGHRADLLAQDCLYTVTELGPRAATTRVVGSLRGYLEQARQPAEVAMALRAPTTHLVTLTVTAPSYADGRASRVFDVIATALEDRWRAGLAPFTVVSCDNLPGNGDITRERVLAAASLRGERLARWVEAYGAFPNSMADRITPPAPDAAARLLHHRYGIHDRAPLVSEPFIRWVLEDSFASRRPPLQEVGVELVSDVRPYVDIKMRMLNAAHLALGYLGAGTPHASTDAAMADPVLGPTVERLLDEVAPLLDPAPGLDPGAYRASVLDRLRNPRIADPLARLRRKGSVRVRNYVVPSLERAVAQARPCPVLTGVVAAWIEDLHRVAAAFEAGEIALADVQDRLQDPDALRLLRPALAARTDVRRLLAEAEGFAQLRHSRSFVEALQRAVAARFGGDVGEAGRVAS
jgi:mannitol-1-phosphate/altronate dehydrogenase